jgi:hypothetical protein
MSNYYQTTFFAPKDALAPTDPNKTIFGAAYDVEFGNLSTAIATKYDSTTISQNPLPANPGTTAIPGIAFSTQPTTGLSTDTQGDLLFSTLGTLQGGFYASGGFAAAGAVGGAQGIGTINVTGLYINGVAQNPTGFAPLNSPGFTGIPTAPTAAVNNNTTQLATTAFVQAQLTSTLSAYATKASPALTGVPTAPTAAANTNTTQIATTANVVATVAAQITANTTLMRSGIASLSTGANSITFTPAFPNSCTAVIVEPISANATTNVSAVSKTGFTATVGVTESYYYIATGT